MEKKVWKAFWRSIGLNLLAGLIVLIPFIFLPNGQSITWGFTAIGIAFLSLLVQLIVGLSNISSPGRKEIGQGMLLSAGVILLIGLAMCGPLWMGL